jgi:hypothetical protein
MASFPSISTGVAIHDPLTETVAAPSKVVEFRSGKTQRWKTRAVFRELVIVITRVTKADSDTIQSFVDSIKGPYDGTWDITIPKTSGNLVVSNLRMLDDSIEWTEGPVGRFSTQIRCQQWK